MTKKIPALLLLLLSTALSAGAQTPDGWVKFSPPGAHFSVLLPSEPKAETQTTQSPSGPYTTNLLTSVGPGREVYIVGWVDYDPKFTFGVQAELEANRDNFIKGAKAKLLGTTPVKLGAHPGMEFKAEMTSPAANVVSRVYVVGRRPYQLIALTPVGQDSSKNVERFLSSFAPAAPK